jgi:hypothetical protein
MFAQRNQAEGHHTHDSNGGKQPRCTLQLESFRAQPRLDRLVIFLNDPACGLLQYTGTRLREVYDVRIAQQDPFQPVLRVWSSDFPDTHGGTVDRRLSAPPVPWTPGSAHRHGRGTHAYMRGARRMVRPLT